MASWFIRHAMRALYPPTEELPGIADTDLDGFLERFQRESPLLMWAGLCAGTFAFVCTPALTIRTPLPSFMLSDEKLDAHANAVASSNIYLLRQSAFLVKLAAGMCWGGDADVRAKVALEPYPPEPSRWRST